jgi:hypothetical protein
MDPRAFLDTLFLSCSFAQGGRDGTRGGRGVTMMAPRTVLIVSDVELAVGARVFHRTDRVRRDVLAIVDAMLAGTEPARAEAGMTIGLPPL